MEVITRKDGSTGNRYSVATNAGRGFVEVFGEEVTLSLEKNISLKKNYVTSIEKKSSRALNKAEVELCYFDLFGNKECKAFLMAENDFVGLKKVIGK